MLNRYQARRLAVVLTMLVCFAAVLRPVRAQDVRAMVLVSAQQHGVPASLALGIARVESGLSCPRKGRYAGPLQILPATARGIGRSVATCAAALDAGMAYLSLALRRAGGSLVGAATLFNRGIGARAGASAYAARVLRTAAR